MEDYEFLAPLRPLLSDPIVVSTVISAATTTDYPDAAWYVLRDVVTRIDPNQAETISRLLLELDIKIDYRSILHLIKQDELEKRRYRPMNVLCKLLVHLRPHWRGNAISASTTMHDLLAARAANNTDDSVHQDIVEFREHIMNMPLADIKNWILHLVSIQMFSTQEFCRSKRIHTDQFAQWYTNANSDVALSRYSGEYVNITIAVRKYIRGLFPPGTIPNKLAKQFTVEPKPTCFNGAVGEIPEAIQNNTFTMVNITSNMSCALPAETIAELRQSHSAFVASVIEDHARSDLDAVIFVDGDNSSAVLREVKLMYGDMPIRIRAFVAISAHTVIRYTQPWIHYVIAPVTTKDSADCALIALMGEMNARLASDAGYIPFIACSADQIFVNAVEFMRVGRRRCGWARFPYESLALYCLKFVRGRYCPAAAEVREYLRNVLTDYYTTLPYAIDTCCKSKYMGSNIGILYILETLRHEFQNDMRIFDGMSRDGRALMLKCIIHVKQSFPVKNNYA